MILFIKNNRFLINVIFIERDVSMLNDKEKTLVCHIIDMELMRLVRLRSDSKNVGLFDSVYKNHIAEIKNIKHKLK